jgi:hypothetical protein
MRAWIAVAGAMQRAATVVEYISSHHAKCGLGFTYWPAEGVSAGVRKAS